MSDLINYSKQLDKLLPTLDHCRQICYYCSNSDKFNTIVSFTTLVDIQSYMFNMNISIERIKSAISRIATRLFYIAPNTYTNFLTLKQFFRCINDDFSEYKIHTKELTYKYNLFYSGKKFKGNILDNLGEFIDGVSPHRPPIDIGYLKCYRRDIIKGSTDMNFKELPMKDFHTWLKILELPFSEKSKAFNAYKTEFTKEWFDYHQKIINKKTVQFSNQNTKKNYPLQLNKLASSQIKKEDAIPINMHHQDNILEGALNQIKEETESLERIHAIECASYVETIETLQKKCIELENINIELQQKYNALEMANAKLVERTKILDESNF